MPKKKSSIDKLPNILRDKINELYRQGCTLDEIMDKLGELSQAAGVDGKLPSRSALHRYTQNLDKIGQDLLKQREIAKALVEKFGDEPADETARLNIEMMHSVVSQVQMQAALGEVVLNPEEAYFLSRSLEALAKAKKLSTDTIIAVRNEALKQAAQVASKEAKEAGLSAKAAAEIRAKILGIK